jgi:hypothetical protein
VKIPALALGALLLATPAAASFPDTFFDLVRKVHPEPDQVEVSRYWIAAPEHSTAVYSRVLQQDYGFVALLAGAKAARDRKIPGTSLTFDENACLTPVHVFDAVFSQVDEVIADKADDPRVRAVAEAQTAAAKQQAAEELGEVIPYWGDIPHICHFTFHTSFTVEDDFERHLQRARRLKEAYEAFSGGDVVTGASRLAAAGLDEGTACLLVDQMLSGGSLSKTPLVGKLAVGLCAGFAGEVLNAASDAVEAGIDAASNVGDAIAGQTQHMPQEEYYRTRWLPRVDEGVDHIRAGSWGPFLKTLWEPCAEYFDNHTMSRDNAQKTCDRFRDAFSAAAVERQKQLDELAANRSEIDRRLPEWGAAFQKLYLDQCQDTECKNQVRQLRADAFTNVASWKPESTLKGWPWVESRLAVFHDRAKQAIALSNERFAQEQVAITDSTIGDWAKLLVASYTKRCHDEKCKGLVGNMGEQYVARGRALQRQHPEESSLGVSKMISAEFGPRFQKLIDDSAARVAVAQNQGAAPRDRLRALGCALHLGRDGIWLCYEDGAYDQCVRYVRSRDAEECTHVPTRRHYPDATGPQAGSGGRPAPIQVRPREERPPVQAQASPRPPIRIPANPSETLERRGCKLFLGRADNWLCTTDAGYDACARFKAQGKARECRRSGP